MLTALKLNCIDDVNCDIIHDCSNLVQIILISFFYIFFDYNDCLTRHVKTVLVQQCYDSSISCLYILCNICNMLATVQSL